MFLKVTVAFWHILWTVLRNIKKSSQKSGNYLDLELGHAFRICTWISTETYGRDDCCMILSQYCRHCTQCLHVARGLWYTWSFAFHHLHISCCIHPMLTMGATHNLWLQSGRVLNHEIRSIQVWVFCLHGVLRNVVMHHIPILTEFHNVSEGDCCILTHSIDNSQKFWKKSQ